MQWTSFRLSRFYFVRRPGRGRRAFFRFARVLRALFTAPPFLPSKLKYFRGTFISSMFSPGSIFTRVLTLHPSFLAQVQAHSDVRHRTYCRAIATVQAARFLQPIVLLPS